MEEGEGQARARSGSGSSGSSDDLGRLLPQAPTAGTPPAAEFKHLGPLLDPPHHHHRAQLAAHLQSLMRETRWVVVVGVLVAVALVVSLVAQVWTLRRVEEAEDIARQLETTLALLHGLHPDAGAQGPAHE